MVPRQELEFGFNELEKNFGASIATLMSDITTLVPGSVNLVYNFVADK
jgi:hypothetical protein